MGSGKATEALARVVVASRLLQEARGPPASSRAGELRAGLAPLAWRARGAGLPKTVGDAEKIDFSQPIGDVPPKLTAIQQSDRVLGYRLAHG